MTKGQMDKLLNGVNTLGIVCNQFGDTGKGKFVDIFASWADIIARGTGGANAGHTIKLGETEHVFHLIPSGILYDAEGKINIIGTGAAFDPLVIMEEIELLKSAGSTYKNLLISRKAHLVMPQHLLMDRIKESKSDGKIGTTGRGIGPVYMDYYARNGLIVNDILNKEIFEKKLKKNLKDKITLLRQYDITQIEEIMKHKHLGGGKFFDAKEIFNFDAMVNAYMEYAKVLENQIADTDTFLREALGKKKILLEGAQGAGLSIDYGTYPYVTSSDCTIGGLAKGVGLTQADVDLTLGIVKAPYMTRVGEGPFPTEMGGTKSAEWCGAAGITKQTEKEKFPNATVNEVDEFVQGVGIRKAGYEYGATTGRPRRTGWLDLPFLRYTTQFSSKDLILTKLDVMDECENIKICSAYTYDGPDFNLGNKILTKGTELKVTIIDEEVMKYCKPVYKTFKGWMTSIREMREASQFPEELKTVISFIETETGCKARIVSVGPDRDETIIV